MTLTPPLQTTAPIPQEIINLIIDEVALQSYNLDHSSRQLDTLKACSITSRSFHFQSRQHLFAEIDFKLDNRAPRRASKLLKILGDTQHDGVISAIRSCNVTLDDPLTALREATYRNSFERLGVGLQQMYLRILKKLNLEEGSGQVVRTFEALSRAERLEHLKIKGHGGLCPWINKKEGIDDSLHRLCKLDTLKSLNIARILDVPDSLLLDLLLASNLRELKLTSITISSSPIPDTSTPTSIDLHDNMPCVLSTIERLEVTGLRFRRFLDILRRSIQQTSPYFISLPHLHTLILPVPTTSWELEDLWQFLLEVLSSLKTLQLQHFQWALHDVFSTGPIRLSSLTSLQQLTFTTTTFDTAHNFCGKLENIGKFLALNTLPTTLTTLTLDVYVHRSLKSRHRDVKLLWKDLYNPGWEAIDSALSSDAFPVLRSAIFNIKLFYYEKGSQVSWSRLERTISVRMLLPRLAELSAVDAHIKLHSVYSRDSFLDQFRVV